MLDANWTSPVRFGLTPTLSGVLDLELAKGVDQFAFVGRGQGHAGQVSAEQRRTYYVGPPAGGQGM